MSKQQEAGRRAPWDRWWVMWASSAVLVAVVIALIMLAVGGGQLPHSSGPAVAAASAGPTSTPHPRATPSPTPSRASAPRASGPTSADAGGRIRYTGASSGSMTFTDAACIIGNGRVAEVDAPMVGDGTPAALSMTRASGGYSVLFLGHYLHSGATRGVTAARDAAGAWSVRLQHVRLADDGEDGATDTHVTVTGVVWCTNANVPG